MTDNFVGEIYSTRCSENKKLNYESAKLQCQLRKAHFTSSEPNVPSVPKPLLIMELPNGEALELLQ